MPILVASPRLSSDFRFHWRGPRHPGLQSWWSDMTSFIMAINFPKFSLLEFWLANLDYPDPPTDRRVEKVIDQNTLLLAWTPPKLTNNRSVKSSGYKIYLNGHLHQQASSPHIAKAIVKNVDTRQYQGFSIQTVGAGGWGSELVQTVLNATVTGPRHGVLEETPSSVKKNEVYSSSRKLLFVAVYNFSPSPGKHGRLELPFLTGERIHVYGEEKADGFYYGEINGRRGLVPCFFIQEVPQT
ncbi:uncharacterized protein LOC144618447 isoform X1 [Crassostrea virginica]